MIPGIREVSLLSRGLCRLAACYVVTEPGAGLRPTQLTSLLQHTERQPLCPAFVGGGTSRAWVLAGEAAVLSSCNILCSNVNVPC